jgi:hypothetical protein
MIVITRTFGKGLNITPGDSTTGTIFVEWTCPDDPKAVDVAVVGNDTTHIQGYGMQAIFRHIVKMSKKIHRIRTTQ